MGQADGEGEGRPDHDRLEAAGLIRVTRLHQTPRLVTARGRARCAQWQRREWTRWGSSSSSTSGHRKAALSRLFGKPSRMRSWTPSSAVRGWRPLNEPPQGR